MNTTFSMPDQFGIVQRTSACMQRDWVANDNTYISGKSPQFTAVLKTLTL